MVTMGVFPFQGKTHIVESGIEPGTSWLVVRNSDHQATRMFNASKSVRRKIHWIAVNLINTNQNLVTGLFRAIIILRRR